MIFVLGIDFGVALGELRHFLQRASAILPHEEMAAIGEGREKRRILGVDPVAVALQFQFADDALLQEAGQVCGRGNFVTRPDFLGDRATAD